MRCMETGRALTGSQLLPHHGHRPLRKHDFLLHDPAHSPACAGPLAVGAAGRTWAVRGRMRSVAVHLHCIRVCIGVRVGAARRAPVAHEDSVGLRQCGDLALEEVVPDEQAGAGLDAQI